MTKEGIVDVLYLHMNIDGGITQECCYFCVFGQTNDQIDDKIFLSGNLHKHTSLVIHKLPQYSGLLNIYRIIHGYNFRRTHNLTINSILVV